MKKKKNSKTEKKNPKKIQQTVALRQYPTRDVFPINVTPAPEKKNC